MALHVREIAVVVQKVVLVLDTVRADDQIDGLPDRDAYRPQPAVICRRAHGQLDIKHRREIETAQQRFDARRLPIVAHALQDFANDDIADEDPLAVVRGIDSAYSTCLRAAGRGS